MTTTPWWMNSSRSCCARSARRPDDVLCFTGVRLEHVDGPPSLLGAKPPQRPFAPWAAVDDLVVFAMIDAFATRHVLGAEMPT
jgi:hypothetical protein